MGRGVQPSARAASWATFFRSLMGCVSLFDIVKRKECEGGGALRHTVANAMAIVVCTCTLQWQMTTDAMFVQDPNKGPPELRFRRITLNLRV